MINNKKQMLMIIGIFALILVLTAGTYAFFNYTRTGAINNLGTGRIYFNSTQGNTLNITNVFPMTSSEASGATLDTVTVGIVGDTTYADGEEFEISLVDVNNTVNGKKIPISFIATYTAASGGTIGSSSETYWEARNSKNASIYTLNTSGDVKEGKQVLVGYIDNGATGISGTLTIKAYIDADRIAISDTYPSGRRYEVNSNMDSNTLSECVNYFTSLGFNNALQTGESLNSFCQGTGTLGGYTFQETLDNNFLFQNDLDYLESHNIINYLFKNGTTNEWVNGRTVLTTSEWNSLGSNPISFKIRAESNEGIWVEEPKGPTMSEMCPGCVYAYTETSFWTTWNTESRTPTVLTSANYKENYEDVITESGKNYFLGLKLNESNQIEKAYACGLYNNITPFCIEGYYDNSKYARNQEILQNEYLWNNTCNVYVDLSDGNTQCPAPSSGLVYSEANSYGYVVAGVGGEGYCNVYSDGGVNCVELV